ncbi:40S ribosomal protein S19-2 [Cyclospora cayetanensis]|nr:40S ribosomal protein S19-2 [Cyclospora cayetanensis]
MEAFLEEFALGSSPVYTVKDVLAQTFIQAYANHLKKRGKFQVPMWVDLVKTGYGKTLAPQDPDWLYCRAAAILRHLYLRPSCGVGAFRKFFSCKTGKKCSPGHTSKASGKIIRHILQQFEAMGLVESRPDSGRRLTKVGQKELDVIARQCVLSASV